MGGSPMVAGGSCRAAASRCWRDRRRRPRPQSGTPRWRRWPRQLRPDPRGGRSARDSGDPRAADMLGALQAGKLYVGPGQALFIKTETGVAAADTGDAGPGGRRPTALKPVRLNNPVRNAIAAALGGCACSRPIRRCGWQRGRGGVPVARSGLAAGARPGPGEGDRPGSQGAADCRRARRPCCSPRTPRPRTGLRRSRCCANAAISPPAACSRAAAAETQPEDRGEPPRAAVAAIDSRLQLWSIVAESLLRAQPRLGAAAGGGRSGDHLRRHGRHQHGAWRDGHDRRLCDLRRAAGDARIPARILRRQSACRGAGGISRRRSDRHRDRAQPDPLALRKAARNAARDLGAVAGLAAGRAVDLRRQQPRCR